MEISKYYSFSIVIPSLNEENYIADCLNSILKQDYDTEKIEIIISDGYSTDKTRSIIADYIRTHKNIILVDNPEKKTPQALNIGIKNSHNEVVVILGAHTKLDNNFIKYNNFYLNTKNVMVSGGTQINVGKTFVQKLIGTVMEIPFAFGSANYRWSTKEQYVDTVVYAAYKRELFDEVGYFEERMTISEDAEFNWRIRQAGYKIFYSPKIISYYYPRNSIKKFLKQLFRYGILRVNVLKKHIDAIKVMHLIPPGFVLLLLTFLTASFFSITALKIFSVLLLVYFAISILLTLIKLPAKKVAFLPMIPILIFSMHIAWGTGFLVGLFSPKSKQY